MAKNMLVRAKILKSRRYRCATCHPLQFFPKNNLRIQKVRVGVSLYVQLTFYGAL